jgi:hypothetical protein
MCFVAFYYFLLLIVVDNRASDLELLVESNLNDRLAAVQVGQAQQFKGYGDGIYPIQSHCIGKHTGLTTPEDRYENGIMTKIRISNEWGYGVTGNLFKLVKYKLGLKIRKSVEVSRYYFVATLLRNIHLCLYDGLTASYFDCPAPDLEDYFAQRQPVF